MYLVGNCVSLCVFDSTGAPQDVSIRCRCFVWISEKKAVVSPRGPRFTMTLEALGLRNKLVCVEVSRRHT